MGGRLHDAWRLSVGTLTAVPVRAPNRVDRDTAGLSMVLAPLAVVPLGVMAALVLWGGRELGLPPLAVGLMAVGALALGSRAFHLDGLADTADGLTASYDRERSLDVMRSGAAGPAGVGALVVVLGIQAAALAPLLAGRAPVVAGVLVCVSRVAVTITCARGVPPARPDGLGASHAGSVPRPVAIAAWLAAGAAAAAALAWADGTWWHLVIGFVVAAVAVSLLVLRAVRRLGGVTGDVHGAAIEVTLAILLLSA
jgi:adenosylcobinamide-GDP ribazoletransferase